MNDLDQRLRKKLLEAAQAEPPVLRAPADDARLVQALLRERSSARVRPLKLALAVGLASAAAWLLLLRPPASPSARAPVATPTAAPPCALPTELALMSDGAGKQRLALGRFGQLVASPDAELTVVKADVCSLTVRLDHGLLAGDLNSLRPASLTIETSLGSVLVRGTVFSVEAREQLEVVLLSGKVEVADGTTRVLEPQQVYRRNQQARGVTRVALEQATRIHTLLSEPSAPEAAPEAVPRPVASVESARKRPETSSSSLLQRAESERRRGELEKARSLYDEAASRGDDNGEVALLRWVRLELQTRSLPRAEQLLLRHTARFPSGKLKAEAAWLQVKLAAERADDAAASRAARDLLQRFPGTPQAAAAEAWLRSP